MVAVSKNFVNYASIALDLSSATSKTAAAMLLDITRANAAQAKHPAACLPAGMEADQPTLNVTMGLNADGSPP